MPLGNIFPEPLLPGEVGAPDLSHLPPIYIIASRTPPGFKDDFGRSLKKCCAKVVDDPAEATIFIGMINTKKRAQFELRAVGVWTKEAIDELRMSNSKSRKRSRETSQEVSRKAQKREESETASGSETEEEAHRVKASPAPWLLPNGRFCSDVFVIKLQWLQETLAQDKLLDPNAYLVFRGKHVTKPGSIVTSDDFDRVDSALTESSIPASQATQDAGDDILQRARADTSPAVGGNASRFLSAPHGRRRFRDQSQAVKIGGSLSRPKLIDLQTSSQEGTADYDLPALPAWVRDGKKYSCERVTLEHSPNDEFIGLLVKIRLSRLLNGDQIGFKAYSTSIASLASITTKIVNPKEILRLPGCDVAVANLWIEYRNTGTIEAAQEVDTNESLQIMKDFYEIWGVGEVTAREFYEEKGWRDRDDILEYGWHGLSRVQQIGLKYYDDFQVGIPRPEVEFILDKVREHAIKVRDDGIEAIVVGGYRRGKAESGDVDIIISHRDFDMTANLVEDIVISLETEGWVTHTLSLHLTGTKRGQETLPLRSVDKIPGSGFDTLDKALVVWQDINWPTKENDRLENPKAKNPNIHRRVDIIISPWRTVGCAVLGWSGGTTFQRDIRRFATETKEWKFDSSGIRSRRTGNVVELEGPHGVDGSMVDAEKVVFAGIGLEYREPYERWTR